MCRFFVCQKDCLTRLRSVIQVKGYRKILFKPKSRRPVRKLVPMSQERKSQKFKTFSAWSMKTLPAKLYFNLQVAF